MANFVTIVNTGSAAALVGDKYAYPLKPCRVLRSHYESAKAKGASLKIVGEDSTDAEPEAAAPATKDDFTVITGIGKKRQADLYQAGIITYEDLLRADADALAKTLGATPEQVKTWQEERYGRSYL